MSSSIEISAELFERVRLYALLHNLTVTKVLEIAIMAALPPLPPLPPVLMVTPPPPTTPPAIMRVARCSCCPGGCDHLFKFRGTYRCGCPRNGRAPDEPRSL